jgi:hypothetical protein
MIRPRIALVVVLRRSTVMLVSANVCAMPIRTSTPRAIG